MAWPPPLLPVNRTESTPQTANHIADHNGANQAINDIVAHITTIKQFSASIVATTLSDGSVNIALPAGMFTATPVALVTNGDGNALPDAVVSVMALYSNASTLVVYVGRAAGGPVANSTLRINYLVTQG